MKVTFALFFLTLLTLASNLQAQNTKPDLSQETNNSFVSVPVTVSDRENRYVTGLKKEDFRVSEENKIQQIEQVSDAEKVPLEIALLIDVSGSVNKIF